MGRKTPIIALCAQKGGTCKTTLTVNFASITHLQNKKTLIVDMDAQSNVGVTWGYRSGQWKSTISDVLLETIHPKKAIYQMEKHLYIMPSSRELSNVPEGLYKKKRDVHLQLRHALSPIVNEFDYVFIDSPPSLGWDTKAVLNASTDFIIPVVPEDYSINGLLDTLETYQMIKETNPTLRLLGFMSTMVRLNTKLHSNNLSSILQFCRKKGFNYFESYINHSIAYADSVSSHKKPIILADPKHDVNNYIHNAWNEVIKKMK